MVPSIAPLTTVVTASNEAGGSSALNHHSLRIDFAVGHFSVIVSRVMSERAGDSQFGPNLGRFALTRWTLLLAAADQSPEALETFCLSYW